MQDRRGPGPKSCALFQGISGAEGLGGRGPAQLTPSSLFCKLWVFPRSLGRHIPFC